MQSGVLKVDLHAISLWLPADDSGDMDKWIKASAYGENNEHDRCNAKEKRQNQSRPWRTRA